MIIVLAGSIGRFPVGGHAWVNLQYLCGLRALGHDVYYLEECGAESWVYVWETGETTSDLAYPAAHVRDTLAPFGFGDRWIYRAGDRAEGMDPEMFRELCRHADLLLVRGAPLPLWRPEYGWPRRRAFIDVDPGFTQLALRDRQPLFVGTVARCERLFTLGQRLGAPDCPIPTAGQEWLKTVSPVWLDGWPVAADGAADRFTSILQWRSYGKSHVYRDVAWGQKDDAFAACLDLPRRTAQPLRLALTGGPADRLAAHGWQVVEGWRATRTAALYREFVQTSRAEFGLAKAGYVASRGGWFSDRSVCYLASGRPVLVEDTGLGDWLPIGAGLLTFATPEQALRGIEAINADYLRHRHAARRLAEERFATARVLPPLLDAAMG